MDPAYNMSKLLRLPSPGLQSSHTAAQAPQTDNGGNKLKLPKHSHSQATKPTGQLSRSGIPSARATPRNPALKRYLPGPGVDTRSPRIYHLHSSEVSNHRMLPKGNRAQDLLARRQEARARQPDSSLQTSPASRTASLTKTDWRGIGLQILTSRPATRGSSLQSGMVTSQLNGTLTHKFQYSHQTYRMAHKTTGEAKQLDSSSKPPK
ncbi:Hypothetical predicted protein, partial [Pelobates cultripes]